MRWGTFYHKILVVSAITVVSLITGVGTVCAEPALRPVESSWMMSVGSSWLTDTYLTPLKYKGFGVGIDYERSQAMKFNPERWTQILTATLRYDNTHNPARNASMLYANFAVSWGMQRRFNFPDGITATVGPDVRGDIGVLYNRRNSNNPASVKADITVGAGGALSWTTRVGRMPVTLRYRTAIPVTGVFFSPQYDELYYEIYLGNTAGLAHAAWWGNFFRWDNKLTADLDFSATRLRIGVGYDLLSTKVNNITSCIYNVSFIIGVTTDWFSIPRRKGLPDSDTSVIYAY